MEKRRLSIEISPEEQERFRRLIPWSLMGRIMRLLLKQVLDLVEHHGDIVLGALLTGQLTALDLLKKGGSDSGFIRPEVGIRGQDGSGVDGTSTGHKA
jgi:hypothetical protein